MLSYLMAIHESSLGAIVALQEALPESSLPVRAPIGLLRVVDLEHVSPLHVHGDDEVGSGIGIGLPLGSKFHVAGHVGRYAGMSLQ